MWRLEGNLWEPVLSFHQMILGLRLSSSGLLGAPQSYLRSHLASVLNNNIIFRHTPFPTHSPRARARSGGFSVEWSLVMTHLCEHTGKMPTLAQSMLERPSKYSQITGVLSTY